MDQEAQKNQLSDLKMAELHDLVKELSITENFQANQIRDNRKNLLNKIKRVQELRCLASIRSGYFLRMNSSDAEYVSQLPFMNSKKLNISERIVEMAGVSTIRTQVNRLIKEILNEREELPKFFADLDFHSEQLMPETRSYLPENITPREFFACCTVPALFGFYFTNEFHESFLNFLYQIAEQIPEATFQNFSDHWLFDCIKYYVHAQGVSEFVKSSIGDTLLMLIRDRELLKLAKSKSTKEIATKIETHIPGMISKMTENVKLVPSSVRFLMTKISQLASNQTKKLYRLENFLMDCILIPALNNLKAYDVIPSSYHLDESPNGPTLILQVISTILKNTLHPDRIRKEFPKFDQKLIAANKMKGLITSFACDNYNVSGPKIVHLLPALELHCLFLLFSVPDIFLLTDICKTSIAPQSLQKAAEPIPTNVIVKFDFFRHEIWEFKAYNITKPHIPDDAPKKLTDPIEITGDALFKFLSFAQIDSGAPNELSQFLEHYEKQMILQKNYLTEAYIRHLSCVSSEVIANSEETGTVLIPALEFELSRHKTKIHDDKATLREINRLSRIVDQEIAICSQMAEDALPFLCSHLLNQYIRSNPQFTIDLILKKEDMLLQPSAFFDFMQEKLVSLKDFILPIAEYTLDEVARHFHTYVMQYLSFSEFRNFKKTYQRSDRLYMRDSQSILNKLCVSQAPDSLKELMETKELFEVITDTVRRAMQLEIPLETVREISLSFDMIRQMKEAETDVKITHDELTLAFNFVLLSSNIPDLYTMGKYVQQYLVNIPLGEVVFLTEKENDALKLFCYHITKLDEVLSDY
ncbi:hypothetical protein TRFO_08114 [Tritrichomonas foetus]|uniref:Uncharacterized protein n=1 Tax=Tritrichomonas foetus TaxID=1144522 RepID=A0A1J4JLZ7_9EUKA|nr:hypothetical protein TRFO_08114 [Tritrichomonas foetus]|eukprot:OHT00119.1 hypothetical protein TRFO_08114 [Tritrichomonas foetus]